MLTPTTSNFLKEQTNLQQTGPGTYSISWHNDWLVGLYLSGTVIAAALHRAASAYIEAELPAQPDVLKMHIEFLRGCVASDSSIKVTQVKLGAVLSTLHLELQQKGKTKVIALATVTDLTKPMGLSLPPSDWFLQPRPSPVPDFEAVDAEKPDLNWLRYRLDDEVAPITRHMLYMYPMIGFPHQGMTEGWMRMASDGDSIDASFLGAMCDFVSSPADTGLRNGGLYDAHTNHGIVKKWAAAQNPPWGGPPAILSVKRETAFKTAVHHYTVTLDVEFKRRIPSEGLRWVYTRSGTRMARDGRMDLDVVLCDENMELLCVGHQLQMIVDAKRRFGPEKTGPSL